MPLLNCKWCGLRFANVAERREHEKVCSKKPGYVAESSSFVAEEIR
jgi:hypothetical protein